MGHTPKGNGGLEPARDINGKAPRELVQATGASRPNKLLRSGESRLRTGPNRAQGVRSPRFSSSAPSQPNYSSAAIQAAVFSNAGRVTALRRINRPRPTNCCSCASASLQTGAADPFTIGSRLGTGSDVQRRPLWKTFAFSPESCSESTRNLVRPGIALGLPRIPQCHGSVVNTQLDLAQSACP